LVPVTDLTEKDRVARKSQLLLHRYAEAFLRRLPQNLKQADWLTLMLIRIIDENNGRNFEQLEEIDKGSEGLTKDLKDESIERSMASSEKGTSPQWCNVRNRRPLAA
jgi:hypothetical protein